MKHQMLFLLLLISIIIHFISCSSEPELSSTSFSKDSGQEMIFGNDVPRKTFLYEPYPNPSNGWGEVNFGLPTSMYVNVIVQNPLGDNIRTLVSENLEAGYYAVAWDGRDASGNKFDNGFYFISLYTSDFSQSKVVNLKR